jgi:hypothetical protein
MVWGMLAPDRIVSQRRQKNSGITAAVSHSNDWSVPPNRRSEAIYGPQYLRVRGARQMFGVTDGSFRGAK